MITLFITILIFIASAIFGSYISGMFVDLKTLLYLVGVSGMFGTLAGILISYRLGKTRVVRTTSVAMHKVTHINVSDDEHDDSIFIFLTYKVGGDDNKEEKEEGFYPPHTKTTRLDPFETLVSIEKGDTEQVQITTLTPQKNPWFLADIKKEYILFVTDSSDKRLLSRISKK